jgi:hypothetical protein
MDNFAGDIGKWDEFKKLFTQEDKATLERILKKVDIDVYTRVNLDTTLTKQDKTWVANFVWRAILWGFY